MGYWILVGFFTAYGIICALLTLYGMILSRLSRGADTLLLVPKREDAPFFLWLKEMGIIRCRIFVKDAPELIDALEMNAEEIIIGRHSSGDDGSGIN